MRTLIAGTLVLLFAIFFCISVAHDDEVAFVEDDVDDVKVFLKLFLC